MLGEVVRDWVREMVPREDESAPEALEGMFRRSVAFCRSHPLLPALLRDVPSTADVICQLQSDYSGRAWRGEASFPDDPRVIESAIGLIRAAVDAT